jgi:hypothetical protein
MQIVEGKDAPASDHSFGAGDKSALAWDRGWSDSEASILSKPDRSHAMSLSDRLHYVERNAASLPIRFPSDVAE